MHGVTYSIVLHQQEGIRAWEDAETPSQVSRVLWPKLTVIRQLAPKIASPALTSTPQPRASRADMVL